MVEIFQSVTDVLAATPQPPRTLRERVYAACEEQNWRPLRFTIRLNGGPHYCAADHEILKFAVLAASDAVLRQFAKQLQGEAPQEDA